MKSWTKLLPYFIVAWIAKKHCERWPDIKGSREGDVFVIPYQDCRIYLK